MKTKKKVQVKLTMNKESRKTIYQNIELPFGSPVLGILERTGTPGEYTEPDCLHFHNHLEIGYCYYDNGHMQIDDTKLLYSSNTFTVIPRGLPHMTSSNDKIGYLWEYLFIDVNGFLLDIYKNNSHMANHLITRINQQAHMAKASEQQEIASLICKILNVIREQKDFYLEEARGLVLSLLICLARWNRPSAHPGEYILPTDNSTIISPALDYINREPGHPFKIEELARMCHISETHFRRVFLEYMKMPPVKYINFIRIRRACDELTRTDDFINAIAGRAGFSSLSSFNRNFRQITGLSPQQFRKHPELYSPESALSSPRT